MSESGYNNTTLKQSNRGLILRLVATGECETRIELARKTGLSKMAATNIIGEFIEQGLLSEGGKQRVTGKGRNPVILSIADTAPKILSVHLYRDEWRVGLCDITLRLLYGTGFPVNADTSADVMERLYRAIDEVIAYADTYKEAIFGMGVGSVGPVDVSKGMILNPPNFFGIRDLPVARLLRERYDMPVCFDSQYNCAALMEKYYGRCRGSDDFVFVGISNGIGSGVIAGGKILRNCYGMTSEIGHVSIDWHGRLCGCGNRGCMEAYASVPVMEAEMQEATGRDLSFREFCLLEQARQGEADAGQLALLSASETEGVSGVFEKFVESLACGLTNVVNTLNPQKIIIGHMGYWIPDIYITKLEEEINRRKMMSREKPVRVEKSEFEDQTQRQGSACALLTRIFDGEFF